MSYLGPSIKVAPLGVGILATNPLAPLHIGGGVLNNSVDTTVLVSRLVGDEVIGSGHGYSDSSDVFRSGGISYNSYDSRILFSGVNNFGHFAAFQDAPEFSSLGSIDFLYGFISVPSVSAGTVLNRRGLHIGDPVLMGGTVVNNYGIYIAPQLAGGTLNYSIYSEGDSLIFFGGNVGIGVESPSSAVSLAAAKSLAFYSGTNQRAGDVVLVGGTKTVSNTTVTINTRIFLTRKVAGGTIGFAVTYTVIAATSFTITSDNVLDTSTYSYLLIENP